MSVRYTVQLQDGRTFGPETVDGLVRWAHQRRIPTDAYLVPDDGSPAIPVGQQPTVWQALCQAAQTPPAATESEAVATVVPYRNPPALAAYYTSIGSLIPGVGMIAGPIAIVLGVLGLRKKAKDPRVKGTAHAAVGITLGSIVTLAHLGVIVLIIVSAANA